MAEKEISTGHLRAFRWMDVKTKPRRLVVDLSYAPKPETPQSQEIGVRLVLTPEQALALSQSIVQVLAASDAPRREQ